MSTRYLAARIRDLETQVQALDALRAKVENYFETHGAEHEDADCPEDDTCTCPLVRDINDAFAAVRRVMP